MDNEELIKAIKSDRRGSDGSDIPALFRVND